MRRRGPRSRRGQRRRSSPYAPRTRQRPSWSAIERRVRNRTCHHRSKCTYVGTLAQRHASPGQDTRVGRRTKVAPLKKVTQCCVGKNNLVDSGSGFKNAHRRRARRSSLWPPMPPQSMLRSRKRIVFFKNGRLFFPRVRHSSWQLPTLNKGAWGRGGRPELCWMGVYLSRTGIQATREIGHAQCKNEVSLRLACLPCARPALLVDPEWDSEGPTIGQL